MAEYIGVMEMPNGGYEHNNRVYSGVSEVPGYCPALSSREWKDPIKVLVCEEVSNDRCNYNSG